ncbi:response regulator [Xylophilus sp. Kf1]|nr:response regulator [Xylophilus sp. Kf1]
MYSLRFRRPLRSVERRGQQRPRCLVVDDDPVCRARLQSQLRMLGLDTLAAGTLQNALALIARHRPEMVLIDSCLPDGDGCGLARRIRASPPYGSVLLVGFSALAGEAHRQRCLGAGMDRVLCKPAALPVLASALGLDVHPVVSCSSPGGFSASLQALYRDSCLRDLAGLRQAVRGHDRERARAYAHRIRGASQLMGHHAVAGLAAVLERVHADRLGDRHAQANALRWLGRMLSPFADGVRSEP